LIYASGENTSKSLTPQDKIEGRERKKEGGRKGDVYISTNKKKT
jgi:hypothetical protein